jgi:hypothetical protein
MKMLLIGGGAHGTLKETDRPRIEIPVRAIDDDCFERHVYRSQAMVLKAGRFGVLVHSEVDPFLPDFPWLALDAAMHALKIDPCA